MAQKEVTQIDYMEPAETSAVADHGAKSLLRKIDLCLLPVMAISYMFQFLDKTALNSAAILGVRKDLALSGKDYSWASSIYYFGYLIASYPAAWLMIRMPVGKLVALSVLLWGAVLMLHVVAENSRGLLAIRFFLGVFEAPLSPGLAIIVAMWYQRSEQPLRHSLWYLGSSSAGIIGGFLSFGIGHVKSIAAWKAIFLIYGAATIAWAVLILFILPDIPSSAWFLSKPERNMAITRVKANMTGIRNNQFKWYQAREALLDPKTWFLVVAQFAISIANSANNFSAIIVHGFGFSQLNTLLLTSGEYVSPLLTMILVGYVATRVPNTRLYLAAAVLTVGMTGIVITRQLPTHMRWGRYAGMVVRGCFGASFPLLTTVISNNTAGYTKKTTTNAIIFISYCVGNIVGPQLFFPSEAPRYQSGFLAAAICLAAAIVDCLLLRFYLVWENKRRDRADATEGKTTLIDLDNEEVKKLDETDREMHHFRYLY